MSVETVACAVCDRSVLGLYRTLAQTAKFGLEELFAHSREPATHSHSSSVSLPQDRVSASRWW